MNLAQMYNLIYGDLGVPDTNRFPMPLVIEWINKAQNMLNHVSLTIRKTAYIDFVGNQRTYALPTDIEALCIDKIWNAIGSEATYRYPCMKTDKTELDNMDLIWKFIIGIPSAWYIDFGETLPLAFWRIPSFSCTNGVQIDYRSTHTKMTRYYATGTVTVVNGSKIVTGLGTTFIGNVVAGDEIGIGALQNSSVSFPTTFYTIASVDTNLQLTLTTNYAGTSAATQNFITSAVSSFTSEIVNLATVKYTEAQAKFKDKEYQLSAELMEEARQEAINEGIHLGSYPMRVESSKPLGAFSGNPPSFWDYGRTSGSKY
jgi:hypothetical protein